jgi:hypothetical protein
MPTGLSRAAHDMLGPQIPRKMLASQVILAVKCTCELLRFIESP